MRGKIIIDSQFASKYWEFIKLSGLTYHTAPLIFRKIDRKISSNQTTWIKIDLGKREKPNNF